MNPSITQERAIYSELADDPDLGELVEMFVDEMPDRIQCLTDYLADEDWEGVRCIAHQLKGAAGSYGFTHVTPYAARLEHAIKSNCPEADIRQAFDELVDICGALRAGSPA